MSTQNKCLLATFLIETESQNASASFKQNMAAMASDGPSPHSPSLRLGLPALQPSSQSLLGPSLHDPRTHHVLESHPERAVQHTTTHYNTQQHSALDRLIFHVRVFARERDSVKASMCARARLLSVSF